MKRGPVMVAQEGARAMVLIHQGHQPHTSVERNGLRVASNRHCWPLRTKSANPTL